MRFRTPLSEIDEATCTDVKQTWGKLKKEVEDKYKAVPLSQFCHMKKRKDADKFVKHKKEKEVSYLEMLTKGNIFCKYLKKF